ncbi:MAG: rod shape-determining protein RodA [Alphaproteobacteria bacterium]|nr:rod shape-determining protein RodA [Alphaproteobacteria bacterium]
MELSRSSRHHMSIMARVARINWVVVLLLSLTACVGFVLLYSAAGGNFDPWATRQMTRFVMGLGLCLLVATIDVRFWLRNAYIIYFAAMGLLGLIELIGTGTGAQRWIQIAGVRIQPSELMKIAVVLALARYFHKIQMEDVAKPLYLIMPVALVFAPALLVLKQPDLGTAMMLLLVGAAVFFVAGVRVWKFVAVGLGGLAAIPVVWANLHGYQKLRVLTFLEPERDPLGAGYHILQSKIALGAGGLTGKGFLQGTQSHLNFLPEQQTDFIFTILAEEFGFVGALFLLGCYAGLILYGVTVALRARNQFGRVLAIGVTINFFLYVFINIAMVTGLIPVVGVPLPLVSYGGTVMLSLLFGFGLIMCIAIHRDVQITRREGDGL